MDKEKLSKIRAKLYGSVRAYKVNFIEFFEAMDKLDKLLLETTQQPKDAES